MRFLLKGWLPAGRFSLARDDARQYTTNPELAGFYREQEARQRRTFDEKVRYTAALI
jgi:hypothetical protein